MPDEIQDKIEVIGEKPNSWWYRVYALVAVVTVLVIAALGTFTYIFSN
jgi:hypothetical protein